MCDILLYIFPPPSHNRPVCLSLPCSTPTLFTPPSLSILPFYLSFCIPPLSFSLSSLFSSILPVHHLNPSFSSCILTVVFHFSLILILHLNLFSYLTVNAVDTARYSASRHCFVLYLSVTLALAVPFDSVINPSSMVADRDR